MNRIARNQTRLRVALAASGVASDVLVAWTEIVGGTVDPGTGGVSGGTEYFLSGLLPGFVHEEPPLNVERKFAEVQAGDLILEVAPHPEVRVFDGQLFLSGVVALDQLANRGVRFRHNGRFYTSKDVSPDLQTAWDATVKNVPFARTLLLKRMT